MPPSRSSGFRRTAARAISAAVGLAVLAEDAAAALRINTPDQVNVSAAVVEGGSAAECAARLSAAAGKAAALSNATSHPNELSPGLRAFHDNTLRLDGRGEAQALGQLSNVYVTGHAADGRPLHGVITTFVRTEIARPPGTPADAPSRISGAWVWLERMAEVSDGDAGRTVQRPRVHRFDFAGEMLPAYGAWGHATDSCRVGGDGAWYGAVFVWTYRPS